MFRDLFGRYPMHRRGPRLKLLRSRTDRSRSTRTLMTTEVWGGPPTGLFLLPMLVTRAMLFLPVS